MLDAMLLIKTFVKNDDFDHLIVMDGDGEDRPEEIKILVEKVLSSENTSVVGKRIKRSEGIFFQFLYQLAQNYYFNFYREKY